MTFDAWAEKWLAAKTCGG